MLRSIRRFGKLLSVTYRNWSVDGGSLLAAAIAYYVAVALFPLLLILLSGVGFVLESTEVGENAQSQILKAIGEQVSPSLMSQLDTVFAQVRNRATTGGPIGLAMLLMVVIALFTQIDAAFNRIWNIEDKSRGVWGSIWHVVFVRLRAFLMLAGLMLLIGVVFISGMMISTVQELAGDSFPLPERATWTTQFIVSFALNAVVFTLVYYLIPNIHVPWQAALRGGLLAAVTWEIGRQILAAYVIGQKYNNAYGVIGAFLAVMLWAYYGATVILFGAEFVQVLSRMSQLRTSSDTRPGHR